ncbi:ABC transporter substrate-binding protein [Clostridium aminobutyricum]|uniref:ABC transporter substrate-binding protein n=1 Tax=Clostridium aminobutyricum TaxID=33953 RepID=A0A939IIR7_CLOAM|nr:ABC transporter substrate-binding protein [Clostridium aminobutyricum]MBN7773351.1 ABC transporter substrate-binding protein [Clostridium aminobutyricum]
MIRKRLLRVGTGKKVPFTQLVKIRNFTAWTIGLLCIVLLSGCSGNISHAEKYTGDKADTENSVIRIAYSGKLDESPLFAAVENGYFEEQGIRVELINGEDAEIQEGIRSGTIDGVTADYRFFKSIEEGLPLQFTAGLHAGCIRLIVPADSEIGSVTDLQNATIGIEAPGDGTMVIASMLFKNNDMYQDGEEVQWSCYGEAGYEKAFQNKEIDAAFIWEPAENTAEQLDQTYRTIFATAQKSSTGGHGHNHSSSIHFTRSFVGLSGKLIQEHRDKAAFITKAWLEGAVWVSENPEAAVKLAASKYGVKGSYEDNMELISSYMWTNGVKDAKPNIQYYITEQRANGLLDNTLEEEDFYRKVFAEILPEFQ